MAVLTTVSACNGDRMESNTERYVEQAFDSIEFYSFYKKVYNFDSLKSAVLNKLSDSSHAMHKELSAAIRAIDIHSYILTKEEYALLESGTDPEVQDNPYPFQGKMLFDRYAYVAVNGFRGVDSISSHNYADSLQQIVLHLHDYDPEGWIIDLRNNSGGWIYPMISGLGPILGQGIKAYEIDREGSEEEYYFAKDDSTYLQLTDSVFFFEDELPVAVLIGKETGSAGELLSLCFRGNPKTVLIGEPTYGVATGHRGFFMPDSAYFAITNSIMTDRNRKGDGHSVHPAVTATNAVDAFEYAYEWIEKNNGQHNENESGMKAQ